MKILLRLFVILLLGIGGTVAYMVNFENGYLYFPDWEVVQTPEDAGLVFRDVSFKSGDGTMCTAGICRMHMPGSHCCICTAMAAI